MGTLSGWQLPFITYVDKVKVIRFVRYCHRCIKLTTLIKMSTNSPSRRSVILESSSRLGLAEDSRSPLTQEIYQLRINAKMSRYEEGQLCIFFGNN